MFNENQIRKIMVESWLARNEELVDSAEAPSLMHVLVKLQMAKEHLTFKYRDIEAVETGIVSAMSELIDIIRMADPDNAKAVL